MRYFRAFYTSEESVSWTDALEPIHDEFDDRVFALPYRRNGYSEEAPERFCIVLVAKDGSMAEGTAQGHMEHALRTWGLRDLVQTRIEECTIEGCFMDDVYRFSCCAFDESQIKAQLNLSNAYTFAARTGGGLKERIVGKPLDRDAATSLASGSRYADSLGAELEHIFAPVLPAASEGAANSRGAAFAPISYVVEGNAPFDADEAIGILLGALMGAGRIDSGHVFAIDVDNYMRWPMRDADADRSVLLNHQLMRAIEGNILVIRYGAFEASGGYDVAAYALFAKLLDLLEDVECRTQVVFSVPEGKKDMVMRLRKRYGKPVVLIGKDSGTDAGSAPYEQNLERMKEMARARGMEADADMGALLSKRMRASRRTDLEDIFEEWAAYHDARRAFPQYADAIDEAINLEGEDAGAAAIDRLEGLIGLSGVKEHVRNIILRVEMGQRLMEKGLPREPFSMHMAFMGAPGTGKTEVARLYAEILKDKGILSEGRLVTVSGGSGFNVERAFEAAAGSVLFVDEAYGMAGVPGMVTEFIAQMENNRAGTVVILAGYEGHMNALLDSNPGFRSRVQTTIVFPDYTTEELRRIFAFMCERQQVVMGDGVERVVRDVMERGGKRDDQGNARFVRKLFEDAVGAQQVRLAKLFKEGGEADLSLDDLRTMTLEDIERAAAEAGVVRKDAATTGREELEALVGLEGIKKAVSARMDFARMQKVKRDAGLDAPFVPMHMAFKGNPGTGKTEVARLVGRILREEGVLSVGDFYECSRRDLVTSAVGGSAPKVEDLFSKARGSVVFIDEAYSLIDAAKGGPGDEAINALIDQMEKLRDEVVVIFAGYTNEIDDLLSINPGFRSRVKSQVEFPDYSADELVEILHHMAEGQGYALAEGVDAKARRAIESAMRDGGFGNARFVRNLFEDALVSQSVRLAEAMGGDGSERAFGEQEVADLTTLLPEDFSWRPSAKPAGLVGFAA